MNAVTAAINWASAITVRHIRVNLLPTASWYSWAIGRAYDVPCTFGMDWTEKRSASMYASPRNQDPTILPTTAIGARNSAFLASSATWAAVSQPSKVYTA